MKPHIEGLTVGLVVAFAAVSLVIWVAVYRMWRRTGGVLPHTPRRRVPWGPVGLVLAAFFIGDKIMGGEPALPTTSGLVQWSVFELVATAFGLMLLRGVSRASGGNLGLPASLREGIEDALLGLLAALASLGPVYLVLYGLMAIFGPIPQNPLLERLLADPSPALLAATAFAAVIAAPVFEEFVFRLLIQGWLEKVLVPHGAVTEPGPEQPENAATEPSAVPPIEPPTNPPAEPPSDPPTEPTGMGERTYWLPIAISSMIFAAAHLGYGYSPVPLFLLALILGYVYQRTHRIVPCIAAHMAFNGISVAMAALEILAKPAAAA